MHPLPFSDIIDITLPWDDQTGCPPPYPGDEPFRRTWRRDGAALTSRLACESHLGTHLDFPAHCLPGGRTQDGYALRDFFRPALVVEAPGERVTAADVPPETPPGGALLFRTRHSRLGLTGRLPVEPDFAWLTPQAAEACVRRQAGLVGIDCHSVDPFDSPDAPAHAILLGAGALILENADLRAVRPGPYLLLALPLPILGAEGSPVRAGLIPWPDRA